MVSIVLFDWGGVLCEDNTSYTARRIAQEYDLDRKDVQKALCSVEHEFIASDDCSGIFSRVNSVLGIDMDEGVLEVLFNETPVRQEVLDLAKSLKSSGYVIGILSNQVACRSRYLRLHNDLSMFDHVFFSSEMGLEKPKREIFDAVLENMGVQASEYLFIDDQKRNIVVATEIGMKGIVFENIEDLKSQLRSLNVSF